MSLINSSSSTSTTQWCTLSRLNLLCKMTSGKTLIIRRKIIAVIDATFAVAKRKPEKFRPVGDSNRYCIVEVKGSNTVQR